MFETQKEYVMKDGDILLFRDIFSIPLAAGLVSIKEHFYQSSFIKEPVIVFSIGDEYSGIKSALWRNVEKYAIKDSKQALSEFVRKHTQKLLEIDVYADKNNLELSRFDKLQIATIAQDRVINKQTMLEILKDFDLLKSKIDTETY